MEKPYQPKVLKTLAGFHVEGTVFRNLPQVLFKPRGLIIWGAPPMAVVRQALVGRNNQLNVSYDAVPAAWFANWKSYDEIANALERGLEPPGWGDWDACPPGVIIEVQISVNEKPVTEGIQLAMWGETVR